MPYTLISYLLLGEQIDNCTTMSCDIFRTPFLRHHVYRIIDNLLLYNTFVHFCPFILSRLTLHIMMFAYLPHILSIAISAVKF